jgi:hypothetical protein
MTIPFCILVLLGAAPVFEAQLLDRPAVRGTISALSDESVTLETARGAIALKLDALQELVADAAMPPVETAKIRVYLNDGSVLAAEEYVSGKDRSRIVLQGGLTVEAPVHSVRAVQLQADQGGWDDWAKILDAPPSSDLLVVRAGGHLDAHSGVLHDVTEQRVRFELDGEILPVKRTKIYGLVYHHPADKNLPAPRGFLFDAAGSKWAVRTLKLSGPLHWTTPGGLSIAEPLERVVRLDLSLGKIIYLSDMRPESAVWTPFIGSQSPLPARQRYFAPRRDKNFESEPLRIAGKTFRKGLALHSRTELVYRLPGGFRRLKAAVGIDDAVRPQGKVRLVIGGDEKTLWEGTIAGDEPARPLDLDVAGVRRLTILADFGDRLGSGNYLDLGDARITK